MTIKQSFIDVINKSLSTLKSYADNHRADQSIVKPWAKLQSALDVLGSAKTDENYRAFLQVVSEVSTSSNDPNFKNLSELKKTWISEYPKHHREQNSEQKINAPNHDEALLTKKVSELELDVSLKATEITSLKLSLQWAQDEAKVEVETLKLKVQQTHKDKTTLQSETQKQITLLQNELSDKSSTAERLTTELQTAKIQTQLAEAKTAQAEKEKSQIQLDLQGKLSRAQDELTGARLEFESTKRQAASEKLQLQAELDRSKKENEQLNIKLDSKLETSSQNSTMSYHVNGKQGVVNQSAEDKNPAKLKDLVFCMTPSRHKVCEFLFNTINSATKTQKPTKDIEKAQTVLSMLLYFTYCELDTEKDNTVPKKWKEFSTRENLAVIKQKLPALAKTVEGCPLPEDEKNEKPVVKTDKNFPLRGHIKNILASGYLLTGKEGKHIYQNYIRTTGKSPQEIAKLEVDERFSGVTLTL